MLVELLWAASQDVQDEGALVTNLQTLRLYVYLVSARIFRANYFCQKCEIEILGATKNYFGLPPALVLHHCQLNQSKTICIHHLFAAVHKGYPCYLLELQGQHSFNPIYGYYQFSCDIVICEGWGLDSNYKIVGPFLHCFEFELIIVFITVLLSYSEDILWQFGEVLIIAGDTHRDEFWMGVGLFESYAEFAFVHASRQTLAEVNGLEVEGKKFVYVWGWGVVGLQVLGGSAVQEHEVGDLAETLLHRYYEMLQSIQIWECQLENH